MPNGDSAHPQVQNERETNGNGMLPEDRQKAVETGIVQYQMIAHECDKLRVEVRDLRTQIAGYKVAAEADNSRITELESRAKTAVIERDQAIAERMKYEALFVLIKAQLRAFAVPNEPLIRDMSEEADRALEHMHESARHQMEQQRTDRHYIGGVIPDTNNPRNSVPRPPRSS